MAKTVVGMFDEFTQAQAAVQALQARGFRHEDIGIAANDAKGDHAKLVNAGAATETTAGQSAGQSALKGAGVGSAIGAGTGLVLGLLGVSLLAVPGIGPIVAAGPISAALAGAGIGALAGGLIGGLVQLGVPEEHAHYYAEGVRRGSTLVTVKVEDADANKATEIMNANHAVDVEQRVAHWKKQGWAKFDHKAPAYDHNQIEKERTAYAKMGGRTSNV